MYPRKKLDRRLFQEILICTVWFLYYLDIDPFVQTQNRREIVCIEGVSPTELESYSVTAEIADDSDNETWEYPNDDGLGSLGQDILIDNEDE